MADWTAIAEAWARDHFGNPTSETARELRFSQSGGGGGSLKLDRETGYFRDFKAGESYGVLAMVQRENQTDQAGAREILKPYGLESPSTAVNAGNVGRNISRPVARNFRPTDNAGNVGKQELAREIWQEAEPIGESPEHPFRRWAAHRSLLHPFQTVPDNIRYHAGKGLIVAGLWTLSDSEIDQDNPNAIQTIDRTREKRTYGALGQSVFAIGAYQTARRVWICEGIADALALWTHQQGAVIATCGAVSGIPKRKGVIDYLRGREIVIACDADAVEKGDALRTELKQTGITAHIVSEYDKGATDPAEETARAGFPDIDRYTFDEVSGKLMDVYSLPEADRLAILTCTKRARVQADKPIINTPFRVLSPQEAFDKID